VIEVHRETHARLGIWLYRRKAGLIRPQNPPNPGIKFSNRGLCVAKCLEMATMAA
jgi:hypothetical protein